MQKSTIDPLNLNKRQIHSGKYDAPPPPDGGMWDQLQEQLKAKQQLQLIAKSENQNNYWISLIPSVCRTVKLQLFQNDSKSKVKK